LQDSENQYNKLKKCKKRPKSAKNGKIWAKNGKIDKNSDFLTIFGTLFEISITFHIFLMEQSLTLQMKA